MHAVMMTASPPFYWQPYPPSCWPLALARRE
jgi:hypothetical protein